MNCVTKAEPMHAESGCLRIGQRETGYVAKATLCTCSNFGTGVNFSPL